MDDTQASTGQTSRSLQDNAGANDLEPVAEQLIALARQLRGSNGVDPIKRQAPGTDQKSKESQNHARKRQLYADAARTLYQMRRMRGSLFGNPDIFGEPAWDILLDLYIAIADGKEVSVSSACIGSAAPPTTGLRWLGILAESGLVVREHDEIDQRRVLVRLTEAAVEAMDRYFEVVAVGNTA
ncbi:MAG: MarR family transcriptional regulator [Pseudomonadota bacterium]